MVNSKTLSRRELQLDVWLDKIREYLDDRADADCEGDPTVYRGNREMSLLVELDWARALWLAERLS